MDTNKEQENRYLKSPYSTDDTRNTGQDLLTFNKPLKGGNFIFKENLVYPNDISLQSEKKGSFSYQGISS